MVNKIATFNWLPLVGICVPIVLVIYGVRARILQGRQPSEGHQPSVVRQTHTSPNCTCWEYPFGNRPEDWGYLPMRIIETFENQRPLDHSPWREAGGDWIFLICAVPDSDAAITIGVRNGQPAGGDARLAWSEAILRVSTPASADEFLKAFSTAFHHQLPARLTGTPRCFLRIPTAVFGTELGRLQEGGFEGKGFWTATKWFLQSDERDAEVFFNFNIREKWAEFSEKDPDYRDDLISQLVTELRDGPLPSGE